MESERKWCLKRRVVKCLSSSCHKIFLAKESRKKAYTKDKYVFISSYLEWWWIWSLTFIFLPDKDLELKHTIWCVLNSRIFQNANQFFTWKSELDLFRGFQDFHLNQLFYCLKKVSRTNWLIQGFCWLGTVLSCFFASCWASTSFGN